MKKTTVIISLYKKNLKAISLYIKQHRLSFKDEVEKLYGNLGGEPD